MRYVKALGLSLLAALSVMALSATGASAGEVKGDVTLGANLLAAQQTVGAELALPAHSSLLVPNLNFAIRCNTASLANGVINPLVAGVTRGSGKVSFKECNAFEHKVPAEKDPLLGLPALTKCTIEGSPGAAKGEIVAEAVIQIVRNKANGTAYVLVGPKENEKKEKVFTRIIFGPLCGALAEEEIEVTGSLVGESLGTAIKNAVKEAPEAIQLLFGDKLMFGTNQAFLDGEVKLFYTGGDTGQTIGIEAGP